MAETPRRAAAPPPRGASPSVTASAPLAGDGANQASRPTFDVAPPEREAPVPCTEAAPSVAGRHHSDRAVHAGGPEVAREATEAGHGLRHSPQAAVAATAQASAVP